MIAIKQFLRTNGWMVVVILAGFLITIRFIDPAPPSTITMVALGGAAGLFLAWRKRRGSKR